ncbi:Serine protease, partial [Phytophthora megakarya]
ISENFLYSSMELYCTYSMEDSKPCNKFKSGKYDGTPILYDRDEYWNKRATIPTQARVLFLSSKLDEQTTNKYAEHLLNALKGDNKELIAFDHATQGTIVSTPLIPGDPKSPICGMELLVSYIKNGGNLERMDKSCVKKMPSFNMTIATGLSNAFLTTDDAYNGVCKVDSRWVPIWTGSYFRSCVRVGRRLYRSSFSIVCLSNDMDSMHP